ncbi:hypothetical protein EDB86DRAFT_1014834 [Lactarius hatsudake]|nr:hypothetical protein EDB86DRAFT_1014834 [Lactarius hatsudake]
MGLAFCLSTSRLEGIERCSVPSSPPSPSDDHYAAPSYFGSRPGAARPWVRAAGPAALCEQPQILARVSRSVPSPRFHVQLMVSVFSPVSTTREVLVFRIPGLRCRRGLNGHDSKPLALFSLVMKALGIGGPTFPRGSNEQYTFFFFNDYSALDRNIITSTLVPCQTFSFFCLFPQPINSSVAPIVSLHLSASIQISPAQLSIVF